MATNDQKQQARQKREEAQAAALAAQKRNKNLQILAGVVFVAIVAVVLVVIIAGNGKDKPQGLGSGDEGNVAGVTETKDLLAGIPQQGLSMGKSSAPITVVEFLDVQCPFCKEHQLDQQPKVINQLVKTGKIKLTAQPIALPQMGEDSEAGRTVAIRMANKNAAWNYLNLFYFNQGTEATGYVTDTFLKKLVAAVPKTTTGVTTTPADAAREGDAKTKAALAKIDKLMSDLGVTGTPSFAVGKTGQPASTYKLIEMNGTDPTGDQVIKAVNDFEKKNGQ